jgi:hypothetical protein
MPKASCGLLILNSAFFILNLALTVRVVFYFVNLCVFRGPILLNYLIRNS